MVTAAPIEPTQLVEHLAEAWSDLHPRVDRPHSVAGTMFRHSNAGKCSRFIQYQHLGVEPSEPLTITSRWVFALGQWVHDSWQPAFLELFGGDFCELEVGGHSVWMDGSFSLDVKVVSPTYGTFVVEIKSINGFGYKMAVGAGRGQAEGPRHDAKLQAAMNACSTPDARGAYVCYFSTEAISVNVAKNNAINEFGRFMHFWWLPIEECIALATPEYERLNAIGEWFGANTDCDGAVPQPLIPRRIPAHDIPKAARITDPIKGTWTVENKDGQVLDIGNTWHCGYCAFQTRCANDGA